MNNHCLYKSTNRCSSTSAPWFPVVTDAVCFLCLLYDDAASKEKTGMMKFSVRAAPACKMFVDSASITY